MDEVVVALEALQLHPSNTNTNITTAPIALRLQIRHGDDSIHYLTNQHLTLTLRISSSLFTSLQLTLSHSIRIVLPTLQATAIFDVVPSALLQHDEADIHEDTANLLSVVENDIVYLDQWKPLKPEDEVEVDESSFTNDVNCHPIQLYIWPASVSLASSPKEQYLSSFNISSIPANIENATRRQWAGRWIKCHSFSCISIFQQLYLVYIATSSAPSQSTNLQVWFYISGKSSFKIQAAQQPPLLFAHHPGDQSAIPLKTLAVECTFPALIHSLVEHITHSLSLSKVDAVINRIFFSLHFSTSLLIGQRGTGKSSILQTLWREFRHKCGVHRLSGLDFIGHKAADNSVSEDQEITLGRKLHEIHSSFKEHGPQLLLLDDADIILSQSNSSLSSQLVSWIDEMSSLGTSIGIVASVCDISSISSTYLRSGRFDKQFLIPNLQSHDRLQALTHLLTERDNNGHANIALLATKLTDHTTGFNLRTLHRLCIYASLQAIRRSQQSSEYSGNSGFSDATMWTYEDFEKALQYISSSAIRVSLQDESISASNYLPNSSIWENISGYSNLKQQLSLLIYQWQNPQDCKRLGVRPPSGILFHGESGCGKTLFANAMGQIPGMNHIIATCTDLTSKYFGESERRIRAVFSKAASSTPCVLIFDDIDAIALNRDTPSNTTINNMQSRLLSTLLNCLDGIEERQGVYVIGATNRLGALDSALLRAGRFDRVIEISLPNLDSRYDILESTIRKKGIPIAEGVDFRMLAERTDGCTCAELVQIIQLAIFSAWQENHKANIITIHHFQSALSQIREVF